MKLELTAEEQNKLVRGARSTASMLRRQVGGRDMQLAAADTIDVLRSAQPALKQLNWKPVLGDEESFYAKAPATGKEYLIIWEPSEGVFCPNWDLELPLAKDAEVLKRAAQRDFEEAMAEAFEVKPAAAFGTSHARLLEVADMLQSVAVRFREDEKWRTNDNSLWPDLCAATARYDEMRGLFAAEHRPERVEDTVAELSALYADVRARSEKVLNSVIEDALNNGWTAVLSGEAGLQVHDRQGLLNDEEDLRYYAKTGRVDARWPAILDLVAFHQDAFGFIYDEFGNEPTPEGP